MPFQPSDEAAIHDVRRAYREIFGTEPRLHAPKTFNEKIAWRKLYQRDPRFTQYADKYAVKALVRDVAGPACVTETLWVGQDPAALPWGTLRPPYVIKVTHGSGDALFVKAEPGDKIGAVTEMLRRHLSVCHAALHREWGYRHIPPRVLVEPMIKTADGRAPDDYKFFVYHGRVHFVQLDTGRFTRHLRSVYDSNWRHLPVQFGYPAHETAMPRPARLAEMIALAERIGAAFDFVRVDLYDTPAGIRFGEATFYPGAGREQFSPPEWDEHFGAPWVIA